MSAVNLNSTWFRCYSKAKLEGDSNALVIYVRAALDAAQEALAQPDLDDGEHMAITVALEDLRRMERDLVTDFRKSDHIEPPNAAQK